MPAVRYAVNDAVDLAYLLSVEQELLPVDRVVLLLNGDPGEGSEKRLEFLLSKGARRYPSSQAEIYLRVEEQSRRVEEGGVLFISIATHGFSEGDAHLLLSADSLFRYRTGITTEKLLQATGAARGLRLLIVDACRTQTSRGMGADATARSARPLDLATFARASGYAVFSATGEGSAFPGDRNGLFTGAILEGLRCKAPADSRGFVTLRRLETFVREEVDRRSHGQQQPEVRLSGGVEDFALVRCGPPGAMETEEGTVPGPVGELLEPGENTNVSNPGVALARVFRRGLYATAVIRAESNGVFYRQQPGASPIPAVPGMEIRLPVEYGGPGRFQVYVGLSADPNFLVDEVQLASLPWEDSLKNPVHWLGPVNVILPDR